MLGREAANITDLSDDLRREQHAETANLEQADRVFVEYCGDPGLEVSDMLG